MTPEDADLLRRIERLTGEIERRFPLDAMTEEEGLTAMCNIVCCGLARAASLHAARRWVAVKLRPSRRPHRLGLYFWKHDFVQDGNHTRYLTASGFAKVLADAGIEVVGDRVYAKEVKQ